MFVWTMVEACAASSTHGWSKSCRNFMTYVCFQRWHREATRKGNLQRVPIQSLTWQHVLSAIGLSVRSIFHFETFPGFSKEGYWGRSKRGRGKRRNSCAIVHKRQCNSSQKELVVGHFPSFFKVSRHNYCAIVE